MTVDVTGGIMTVAVVDGTMTGTMADGTMIEITADGIMTGTMANGIKAEVGIIMVVAGMTEAMEEANANTHNKNRKGAT